MNTFKQREDRMYEAVCASCGTTCEVPFRPNGSKPVYCRDCFAKNGGPARSERQDRPFAPRKPFQDRFGGAPFKRPFRPEAPAAPRMDTRAFDTLASELKATNAKLDRMISIAEGFLAAAPASAPTTAPKAPAKKPASKKKKA